MRAATSILVLTSALVSAAPTLLSDVAALSVSPGHASAKNSISTRGLLSSVTSTVVGGTLNVIDTLGKPFDCILSPYKCADKLHSELGL